MALHLGRPRVALSAWVEACRYYEDLEQLSLPVRVDFCRLLTQMSEHIALIGDAQSWARSSSDRLVEMLDLAEPVGKLWDDMRGCFATFHAQWLMHCLSGGPEDRAMVPRVLAAIQGRRLIAETLEAAEAGRAEDGSAVARVVAAKVEMRELLRQLGAAEGVYFSDRGAGEAAGPAVLIGDDMLGAPGSLSGLSGRPARNKARISELREALRLKGLELAEAKAEAAEDPAYAILTAPLSGITTDSLRARLGPGEALVLAFPLPADADVDVDADTTPGDATPGDSSPAGDDARTDASAQDNDFTTWLWALRPDRVEPVVLRLPGRGRAAATYYSGVSGAVAGSLPSTAASLPDVVLRWERYLEGQKGRGGVRRGDWDEPIEERPETGGSEPQAKTESKRAVPKVAPLSGPEMAAFWGELDGALAGLVWEPLAATGALDGVEDILIATAGSLHNLPFEAGRRGPAAGARLMHQSSLATFARSRGLFGARLRIVPAPAATAPTVQLLAHPEEQGIPLAQVERRIAARLWAQVAAEVRTDEDYPWDPAQPVAFAHAACHGTVRTPPGGTPGAHLILRGLVSERALLAGPGAAGWLVSACVGGQVHDDRLDGNATGLVAGALGAGSETVVAALPPLPDREGFLFGLLVTLQLTDGPGAPGLGAAAAVAAALLGGRRGAETLAAHLPRRVLTELGGVAGLTGRLERLDRRMRAALAEDLALTCGDGLAGALNPDEDLTAARRRDDIRGVLEASGAPWLPQPARDRIARTLVPPAAAQTASVQTASVQTIGTLTTSDLITNLTATLTGALGGLTDPFALLPVPGDDPAAEGTIRYGTVIFHSPEPVFTRPG